MSISVTYLVAVVLKGECYANPCVNWLLGNSCVFSFDKEKCIVTNVLSV